MKTPDEFFEWYFEGNYHKRNVPKYDIQKADKVTEEVAREFFTHYFAKEWKKRKEEKELSRVLTEVNRLKKRFPTLYKEVYVKMGGDLSFFEFLERLTNTG